MNKFDLTLYLVTDSSGFSTQEFLLTVEKALQGGVTLVQLREKERDGLSFYNIAYQLRGLTKKYNVPFLVNDRVDIALAVDADGVHLGQEDIPVNVARSLLGADKIIGATVKTTNQAVVAQQSGADYVGVGAIYPTSTKVRTALTSIEVLKNICQAVYVPVVAIGGLKEDNIDILKNSGVDGVAVVSAIIKSADTITDTKILKEKVQGLLK